MRVLDSMAVLKKTQPDIYSPIFPGERLAAVFFVGMKILRSMTILATPYL